MTTAPVVPLQNHDDALEQPVQDWLALEQETSSARGVEGSDRFGALDALRPENYLHFERNVILQLPRISVLKRAVRRMLLSAYDEASLDVCRDVYRKAGVVLDLLAQSEVMPTRVKASVVGGVGITVLLRDGFVYIEPRLDDGELDVMASRVHLGKRDPEIVFLDEFEGDLSKLVKWAVERVRLSWGSI